MMQLKLQDGWAPWCRAESALQPLPTLLCIPTQSVQGSLKRNWLFPASSAAAAKDVWLWWQTHLFQTPSPTAHHYTLGCSNQTTQCEIPYWNSHFCTIPFCSTGTSPLLHSGDVWDPAGKQVWPAHNRTRQSQGWQQSTPPAAKQPSESKMMPTDFLARFPKVSLALTFLHKQLFKIKFM